MQSRVVDGARVELVLAGRLYATAADTLQAAIDAAVARATTMVVDASGLESIDAIALRALLGGVKALRARGGVMIAFGLSEAVRRLFAVTGLDGVIAVVGSRDEALRAAA